MSIIFDEEYSIAYLHIYFSLCILDGLAWSQRNGKSALKILKIHRSDAIFFVINDAFLVPSKVVKISTQKTDSNWFIDPLTKEKVWGKILLSRGGKGRGIVSRASNFDVNANWSETQTAAQWVRMLCRFRAPKRFQRWWISSRIEQNIVFHFFGLILMWSDRKI